MSEGTMISTVDYSTTRCLTSEKPSCFETLENDRGTLLKIPDSAGKIAEGGLRLQGLYKKNSLDKPLITVVTVVYNGAALLEDTIKSVLEQTYDNVEYIIVDGGSKDNTLDIIKKYDHAIDYWVSEPDQGMYDGLSKGFQTVSGTIMAYLNAGDLYVKTALEAVVSVFKKTDCEWLTGMRSVCNEANQIIKVDTPFRYKPSLIRKGVYGKYLPYIQQESTFWRKDLLSALDISFFKRLRYAGDYYLWFCFSTLAELRVAQVQLGIFKLHEGQLSESLDKYWLEINGFSEKPSLMSYLAVLLEVFPWVLSDKFRKIFHSSRITLSDNE